MKKIGFGLAAVSVLALAYVLSTSLPEKKAPPATASLTLIHQSNRLSELEPCGCHYNQNGGIDREANAVNKIRAEVPLVLYVDSGNALAPFKRPLSLEKYQEKAKAVIQAYNETGLDFFSPGPADYALGLSTLKALQKDSDFTWVSTNVQNASGLTPVFRPYDLVSRDGVTYGIVALSDPREVKVSGVVVENPRAALKQVLPRLRRNADFIILLSQLGPDAERKLSEEFPEVRVIVGASPRYSSPHPEWIGGHTLLVDNEVKGQNLGRLDLKIAFPFKAFSSDERIAANQEELQMLEADAKNDPSLAKLVETFARDKDLSPVPGSSHYTHTLVALDGATYGQPNTLTELVKKEKERVRKSALAE